jgi:transcriptional regulator with XRE-family HTH domain
MAPPDVVNRLRAVLLHVPYYSIEGPSRLAQDTGLSRSTISRLCRQRSSPSYRVAEVIAEAISRRSGQPISAGEIFSPNGAYPTPSTCSLMECTGCYPPEAWDEKTQTLKPGWKQQKPGEWSRLTASPTSPVIS